MNAAEALVLMFSRHIHNTEHAGRFEECQDEVCLEARAALEQSGVR